MRVGNNKQLIFGSLYLLLAFVSRNNAAPLEVTPEELAALQNSTEFNSTELESANGLDEAEIASLNVQLAMQQQKIANLEHEVEVESSRISTLGHNLTDKLMDKLQPVLILAQQNLVNLNDLETKAEVNGNRSLRNELEIANVKELVGSLHLGDGDGDVTTPLPKSLTLSGPEMVRLMTIGTAVARGADWKWGNQDGGPGSIGHVTKKLDSDKWIQVKWPNGRENNYRMGYDGKYDLKLSYERHYRKSVLSGSEMVSLMKIGTAVLRGTNWRWENQDGGAGSIGHITKGLDSEKWMKVKWSNGYEDSYRMGAEGKYDLKLADEVMDSPNKV